MGTITDYPHAGNGPIDVNISAGNLEITAGEIAADIPVDGSVTVWNGGAYIGVSSNLTGSVSGSVLVKPSTSSFP